MAMPNTPAGSATGWCRVYGEAPSTNLPSRIGNEQIVWVVTFIRFEGISHAGDCALGTTILRTGCESASNIE
jgi:hypothetical protein